MKQNPTLWRIIIGLIILLSLVFGLYQCKDAKLQQARADLAESKVSEVMKAKQAEINVSVAKAEREAKRLKADSVKKQSEQRALKQEIARLRAKLGKTPTIQAVGGVSYGVFDTLGHSFQGNKEQWDAWLMESLVKDTVIVYQDSLISSLEQQVDTIYLSFNRQLAEKNKQILATNEMNRLLQTELAKSQKGERRQARRKRVWRFIAGTALVIAGTLAATK